MDPKRFAILGFPIRVKASFLIMLGAIFFYGGGFQGGFAALAFALVAFASVLVHELGHAVVARRLGVGVAAIELHFFGGAAQLTSVPRSARDEIFIAAAGPAVSFVLGTLGIGLALLTGAQMLVSVGAINLLLGLFNLVPAFPSDGGRILRAVLARRMGLIAATETAVKVGRVACVAIGVAGIAYGHYQIAVLAAVLWFMGSAERLAVRMRGDDRWRTSESMGGAAVGDDRSAVTPVEYIPPQGVRPPRVGAPRVVYWRP